MTLVTIILIGVALAMDVFAVSVAAGIATHELRLKQALTMAFVFGAFQSFMFYVGFFFGFTIKEFISAFDHWIALAILSFIGIRMVVEGMRKLEHCCKKRDYFNPATLMMLGIATSIDALAVGLSVSFINTDNLTASLIIGAVTFVISILGVFIGDKLSCKIRQEAEICGGIILVAIGIKIVVEHMGMMG